MKSMYYVNKGVERNKKPLKNIIYEVKVIQLKDDSVAEDYEKYKFKDDGYLSLLWGHHSDKIKNYHGFITPGDLKDLLGDKQWAKFCNGKREFIIQRRIEGKNIPKKNK